jgi:hypothetical protein
VQLSWKMKRLHNRPRIRRRLERIEVMLVATTKQLQSVYKVLTWVFILAIVTIVMIWHPHL